MALRMLLAGLVVIFLPSIARATPGPDSVAVLANADVPGSVALAMRYAEARDIPASQVCLLSLPTTPEMTFEELETRLLTPLDACLGANRDRIEAIVIMRGVPIRVPMPSGTRVSVAAAIGLWDSTLADGTPLLGTPPGIAADCGGTPCTRARVPNAYGGEPFEAGWSFTTSEITYRPVLVTMLHGRSDADAMSLLDVALEAEAPGAEGTFLLMRGADGARGVLDVGYPTVLSALSARGVTAEIVDFDADLTGRTLSGFMTGTASLGTTIEGNTYVRGALTDNLTSFGAVPQNFEASGEAQVSIARWVAAGAAGAHGTIDEPLNNCFPQRQLLVDYVDGATLAEAYLGRMPYVYWMNLVLGDPLLAPYAERPEVTIEGLTEGATFESAPLSVRATPPPGRTIASLILYVDGVEAARSDGAALTHCLSPSAAGNHQVLAVARTLGDASAPHPYPAAGWTGIAASARGGATSCAAPDAGTDAALLDAGGSDAGPSTGGGGCACRAGSASRVDGVLPIGPVGMGLLLIALLVRARRPR